ncbi:scavenger receptor cysteine-rich domain-containing group B protein [Sarcophilus harrisii]
MRIGPCPVQTSRGWRPEDGNIIRPLLLPALAFFFLPLGSTLQPTPLPFPEVRLVGGPSRCQGRLEILYNGSWGTVCDDDWDVVDANVVCRQLGCGYALPVPLPLAFGQGRGPIQLDNVDCKGQEAALSECGSHGWGVHNCYHYEDVAVMCDELLPTLAKKMLTSRAPTTMTPKNGIGDGSIRLVRGADPCQGRVEILHDGTWGTVCDDDWGLPDAMVVCRQLDCGSAVASKTNAYFGYGTGHILLDNVHCDGRELRLAACPSLGWGIHNCGHHEDAGVICSGRSAPTVTSSPTLLTRDGKVWLTEPATVTEVAAEPTWEATVLTMASGKKTGRLRLVSGDGPCQGRVEVLHQSRWGTVCDDDWDFADAQVACREAGCGRAVGATVLAYFGYGKGPVLLDNVDCTGVETRLADCFHLGWGQHNCGHHEDAGAICRATLPLSSRGFSDSVPDSFTHSPLAQLIGTFRGQGLCLWARPGLGAVPMLGVSQPPGSGSPRQPEGEGGIALCPPGLAPHLLLLPPGHLRLANGSHRCEGRVELYLLRQWGTVCDDAWDLRAAGVVCRQLGCGEALEAPGEARFGPGQGLILLDNVKCRGGEASLLRCSHIRWNAHNCDHAEDAGAQCRPR